MYPLRPTGGYELVWRSAVAALRSQGHQVRVLTTNDPPLAPGESDEPDVHRDLRWYWHDFTFPRRSLFACASAERHNVRAFERHVHDFRPDAVAWFSMGGMSMSLLELARRSGLPAVAFVHDDWLDYGRRTDGWYRRFRGRPRRARLAEALLGVPTRVGFADAARYLFVSETTRARALVGGIALHETGIAHSGIEASLFSPAPEHAWGWKLLYVGRIDSRKGIDTAVEALAHLPGQATLTIAGEGDARERARLDGLIARLGVQDRVAFAGACPRAHLQERYAACDAVVFPVRWAEPWGLVPLEAMAVGRPVVASGRGGSGEYLRNRENCLQFDAGNPRSLARAVSCLADDAALRARLREGGLATAPRHTEEHFNAVATEALTSAVAAGRRPPAREQIPSQDGGPRVSVVIPTLERNQRLERALQALAAQDLDRDSYEVIVVPDPERDLSGLDNVLEKAGERLSIRRVDRSSPGVGAARNAGWRAARAPIVLFMGDDILGAPRLLREHMSWHEEHPDVRVGVLGHVRWARELRVTPFMRWLEHGLQFNYPSIDGIDAGFGHFYTANVSLKRAMLERVGGFDEERFPFLYEDIELGYRLYLDGFRLLYNRRADAEHLHPTTIEQWRGRMRATAAAERTWVAMRPEFEAYFHDRFLDAAQRAPHRGRLGRALLPFVAPSTPWLGERVWTRASIYYRQQLAPAFLEGWEEAAQAEAEPSPGADARSAVPSGRAPEAPASASAPDPNPKPALASAPAPDSVPPSASPPEPAPAPDPTRTLAIHSGGSDPGGPK